MDAKIRSHLIIAIVAFIAAVVVLWGCGDPPTTAVEQRGAIEVTGILPNDSLTDSITITLDEDSLGCFANPHCCENLLAGTHLVGVGAMDHQGDTTVEYWSMPQLVEVRFDETTLVEFHLVTEAPYVGNVAPDFALYDLDSNLVSLSGLEGEVVMLYFFTST